MLPIARKTYPEISALNSGTLKIPGWVETKNFALWLGDGLSEFGQVVFDVSTRTFTISCDTGAYTYELKLKNQTPSTSVTSTINSVEKTETADVNGIVTYTG